MSKTRRRPRPDAPRAHRALRFRCAAAALLALAACDTPREAKVSRLAPLESARIATPESAPPGSCWAQDVTPAVVETVIDQVLVSPAERGPDGTLLQPARFASETRQEIVEPRRAFRFETVCAADITPQFIASLQRALQARGYYDAPITGIFDAPTDAALRAYQSADGLKTGFLTMRTARAFGLAPALW